MKIIEVTVSPKGESKIETKGLVGGECRQVSRYMEEALGVRANEKLTATRSDGKPGRPHPHEVHVCGPGHQDGFSVHLNR